MSTDVRSNTRRTSKTAVDSLLLRRLLTERQIERIVEALTFRAEGDFTLTFTNGGVLIVPDKISAQARVNKSCYHKCFSRYLTQLGRSTTAAQEHHAEVNYTKCRDRCSRRGSRPRGL